MKILHTADWHLNERLYDRNLTATLQERVEEVAAICEREAVDVLTIAGDLFSEKVEVTPFTNEVAESFRHLRRTFSSFFARGGVILAVTGNHDQDGQIRYWLELTRAGLDLAEPPRSPGDRFAPGKMYFLDYAYFGRVRDREGFDVQFVLLPYPNKARVLTGEERFDTPAESNRVTQEHVAQWIRDLNHAYGYDTSLRTVFVAHLNVTGDVGLDTRYEPGLALDASQIPKMFDYVALGHIHKPKIIKGLSHVRYSGSLDRMNRGETETKEVVLVEIGPNGRRGEPRSIPLTSTKFGDIAVQDPATFREQIEAQIAAGGVPDIPIVTLSEAATAVAPLLEQTIRELLPNAKIEYTRPAVAEPGTVALDDTGSVREKLIAFLDSQLADDADREPLMELATHYLDSRGYR